jgi:hypothetical protein
MTEMFRIKFADGLVNEINHNEDRKMLPDNRLDFISDIDDEYIVMMTNARADFIKIDNELRILGSDPESDKEGVKRCLSLARTNIEIALQYTIKALCLMGEVKQ